MSAGASLAAINELGETPLHRASSKGSEVLVRALLSNGADVNAQIVREGHQYDGRTPLMDAAAAKSLSVVKALLEHGADPLLKDSSGMTALSFAEILGKRVANHLRKVMGRSSGTSDLGLHDAARAAFAIASRRCWPRRPLTRLTTLVARCSTMRPWATTRISSIFYFLDGRLLDPVTDAEAIAERMIAFCPDTVDQAAASIRLLPRTGQVEAVAQELRSTGWSGSGGIYTGARGSGLGARDSTLEL